MGNPPERGPPGLIPARAGKTISEGTDAQTDKAHPRAGGENTAYSVPGVAIHGSSPRGRGKRKQLARKPLLTRLIPARAGKTQDVIFEAEVNGAHPRAGGENTQAITRPPSYLGSSPRGRGKPGALRRACGDDRLIPARAGKTRVRRDALSGESAHPRAGGENTSHGSPRRRELGSSPRGRGKR